MKKQIKKKKEIKISLESVAYIGLTAFTFGMFVEKIVINGFSWLSTCGYFG